MIGYFYVFELVFVGLIVTTLIFFIIINYYFKFRKLPLRFQNNLNALPPRESIKIQQFINNLKIGRAHV